MTKFATNEDFWVHNLLMAQALMETIPDRAFTPALRSFANNAMDEGGPHACGAAACFGGWVAVDPGFQRLGVKRGYDGAPTIDSYSSMQGVSFALFGDTTMFYSADHVTENFNEKKVVLRRIRRRLEELT